MMSHIEGKSYSLDINGTSVWFEIFGSGPRPILLVPGAIGTGRSDYLPQLDGDEDSLNFNEFTIVAVEAPGWGRSRPPARKYGLNVYANDAECFYEIMLHLGYKHYSIIAWSDGTKSALTLATKHPECVMGMVLLGAEIFNSVRANSWLNSVIEMKSWGQPKIDCYLRAYDSCELIQDLWKKYVKSCGYLKLYFGDDMFKGKYHLIKCPVLIILGDKDQISDIDQCLHLNEQIKSSKLIRFATAGHDFHQRYPNVFKRLAEDHLLACKY